MGRETIGIVLLLGIFCMGFVVVYIFLQYISLLKSVKSFQGEILERLNGLEKMMGSNGQKEQGNVPKSSEKEMDR